MKSVRKGISLLITITLLLNNVQIFNSDTIPKNIFAAKSKDTQSPSIPQNLTVTGNTDSSVDLKWDSSTDNIGVKKYNVYLNSKLNKSTKKNSTTLKNLEINTPYTITVRAMDKAKNESLDSNIINLELQTDSIKPSTVKNIIASKVTSSSIKLSWEAATDNIGVLSYDIYRNDTKIASVNKNKYLDENLSEYTEYSYKIVALDGAGNESYMSAPFTVMTKDSTNPTPPSNLAAVSISYTSIDLSWDSSTDNVGVREYEIYNRKKLIASTESNEYKLENLKPDTNYKLTIKSKDAEGNTSDSSNILDVNTLTAPADNIPPSKPLNVIIDDIKDTEITISWESSNDNIGIKKYNIYINGKYKGKTIGGITNYTAKKLKPGRTYVFTIVAVDFSKNLSIESDPINVTTLSPRDNKKPSVPTGINDISKTTTSITLGWIAANDNIGVAGYDIFQEDTLIGSTDGTSYTINGLLPGTFYNFKIRAKDLAGNLSKFSKVYATSTLLKIPDGLKITYDINSVVSFEWNLVDGATAYEVLENNQTAGVVELNKYTKSLVENGATLEFKVRAINNSTQSEWSNAINIVIPESNIISLNAEVNGTNTSLSWTKVQGISEYDIYRDEEKIASVTENSYNDLTLISNKDYFYQVKGKDIYGNVVSLSNIVTITTIDNENPTIPSDFSYQQLTDTTLVLTWNSSTDNVGIKNYHVYKDGVLLNSLGSDVFSYQVTGLAPATSYVFSIKSEDVSGNMSPESSITVATSLSKPIIENITSDDTSITIGWTTVNGAESYEVEINGEIKYTTETIFVENDLNPGSTYIFRVRSVKGSLKSDWSEEASTSTLLPTPQNLTGFQEGLGVYLNWNADEQCSGYNVYRNNELLGPVNGNSFFDANVEINSTYIYKVKGFNENDLVSLFSNEFTITLEDKTAPSIPANFQCINITDTSCVLQWDPSTDNTAISSYLIYLGNDVIGEVFGTTYTATGMESGKTYNFSVKAKDIAGNLSEGNTINITTYDSISPSSPQNLELVSKSDTEIVLKWDESTDNVGITSYEIYSKDELIGTVDSNTLNFKISELNPATNYTFNILAKDAVGNTSVLSNTISVTTNLSKVNNLEGTQNDIGILLTWDQVEVLGYEIYKNGEIIGTSNVNSYLDSDVNIGINYSYTVKAYTVDGIKSESSDEVLIEFRDQVAPTTPENFEAVLSDNSKALLSWDESTDNIEVAGYEIYVNGMILSTVTGTSYEVDNLLSGKTYDFFIKAKDTSGNLSQNSNSISIKTIDNESPSKPSDLQLIDKSDTNATITWTASTDNSEIKDYEIYINGILEGTSENIEYTLSNLLSGTNYTITITAKDYSDNKSEQSDPLEFTTMLSTPKNLQADIKGLNIELSWDDVLNAESYELYKNNEKVTTLSLTNYVDEEVILGETYIYSIKAIGSNNESDMSEQVTIIFEDQESPTIPINLTLIEKTDNMISISWDPSTDNLGMESYELYLGNTLIDTLSEEITEYEFINLDPNTSYEISIIAKDISGNSSDKSEILSVKTALSKVIGLNSNAADIFVDLSWDSVDDSLTYEIYRDNIMISTVSENNYLDLGLTKLTSYTYIIKAIDNDGNESVVSDPYVVTTTDRYVIDTETILSKDVMYGNVIMIFGGSLDLNGYKMNILGDFIHEHGTVIINSGSLEIGNNYRIQSENIDVDGNITYSSSYGYLNMSNDNDYILMNGDFITQSKYTHTDRLSAGTIELKGNFEQIYTTSYVLDNFAPTGTHKVILSGTEFQNIKFATSNSHINILDVRIPDDRLSFGDFISVKEIINNGNELPSLTVSKNTWILNEDEVINGDLYLNGNTTLDLNGYTLIVKGDFIHSWGTFNVNNGKLIVDEDYRIQKEIIDENGNITYSYSYSYLEMTNENDYILVNGDFVTQANNSHTDILSAGTIELKGNFEEINTGCYQSNNFAPIGTHKVLLSGTEFQNIKFATSNSHINILDIRIPDDRLAFGDFISVNEIINNGNELPSLTVSIGDWILNENEVIDGNLYLEGSTLNLNGYTLTINGSLIHSKGNLNINNGILIVNEDYRIQEKTVDENGDILYKRSTGYLHMTNENDYILVKGDFVTQANNSHTDILSAGTIELKGNFEEINTGCYQSNNFAPTGTHKVLLSGTEFQNIKFATSNSHINILDIRIPDDRLAFGDFISVNEIINNGNELPSLTVSIGDWILNENEVIDGNLYLEGSTLNLNGYTLTINGSLIHSKGNLNINNGILIVNEDYRIQEKIVDENGDILYKRSTGYLHMTNENDYILVKGDFVTQANNSHTDILSAGTIELKSNFEEINTGCYQSNNFAPIGTHKVLLSGTEFQNIKFATSNSHINILDIRIPDDRLAFGDFISVNEIINNGNELPSLTVSIGDWILNENEVIDGNLYLEGSTLNLNGYTLTINGSLIHSKGNLNINNGILIVNEDYRIQEKTVDENGDILYKRSTGYLHMTNENDYILVKGDFVTQANNSHTDILSAGIIEMKGNFEEINIGCYQSNNFAPTGTHKVIFSGSDKQTVKFGTSNSHFNNLEVLNNLDGDVEFSTKSYVINELYSTNSNVINSKNIIFTVNSRINGFWEHNLTSDGWMLSSDNEIGGTLYIDSSGLDLSGFRLKVENLIHVKGNVNINHGTLETIGDYRVQEEFIDTNEEYSYGKSYGRLKMLYDDDYIIVGGDFVTELTNSNSSDLIAGILEIKGNFRQIYSGNKYNFTTNGTHKVVFSGDGNQEVEFDYPQDSYFNILEITKSKGIIDFKSESTVVNELISSESTELTIINSKNIGMRGSAKVTGVWKYDLGQYENWTLPQNIELLGTFYIESGTTMLNGKILTVGKDIVQNGGMYLQGGTLNVTENYIHQKGYLYFANGKLYVNKDYKIQTKNDDGTYIGGSGILKMIDSMDLMVVKGNFTTQSSKNVELSDGVLEVKGNFNQIKNTVNYNFNPSNNNKVILSGDSVQEISFDTPKSNYSNFGRLEITNTSTEGVKFITPTIITRELFPTNSVIVNGKNLGLSESAQIITGIWNADLGQFEDWTLHQDLEIEGSFIQTSGTIMLNGFKIDVKKNVSQNGGVYLQGGKLNVKENYIHENGIISFAKGLLKIDKDYRLQKNSNNTYIGSDGILKMIDKEDYMYVGGNFYFQSRYIHKTYLTNGLIELKGNFYQKNNGSVTNNFTPREDQVFLLDGAAKQTISFESTNSIFNILWLTKPVESGYAYDETRSITSYVYRGDKEETKFGKPGTNASNGNYSKTYTDFSIADKGFDIQISRTYNSKGLANPEDPMELKPLKGLFGDGWSFGFEGKIDNYSENNTTTKTVRLPNGSSMTFEEKDGVFTPLGNRSTLEKFSDRYELKSPDQYTYGFNLQGYMIWMKDPNNNKITIMVNGNGKINRITDSTGRYFSITYNAKGFIEKITDPISRAYNYEYNTNGYLEKVTDPSGKITTYIYDVNGRLNKTINNESVTEEVITYYADSFNNGKVSTIKDIFGVTKTYTYSIIDGTKIVDSNNRETTQKFNDAFNIIYFTDTEGKTTYTEYELYDKKFDSYGEVKNIINRNGNKTEYIRNETTGNIEKIINPDSSFKTKEYDEKNNLIKEVDEEGKKTFYIYDSNKVNLLKKVQPLNGTDEYIDGESDIINFAIITYEYNTYGQLLFETDGEGNKKSYTYDQYGNIETQTIPDRGTSTFYSNSIGWKTEETTPSLYQKQYVYDSLGNLELSNEYSLEHTDQGTINRIVYDNMGRITKNITPTQYNSDFDDLANHDYNSDVCYQYTYTPQGLVKTSTDPKGNVTTYDYDSYGNKAKEIMPDGTVYLYTYDSLYRLINVVYKEEDSEVAESILLESYEYTILSNGQTQKKHIKYLNDTETAITLYVYDYAERLVELINPDTSTKKNTYNKNGTIKNEKLENNSKIYYEYDGLNRVNKIWTQVDTYEYSYNEIGYYKNSNKKYEKVSKEKVLLNEIPESTITTNYKYYADGNIKNISDTAGRYTKYEYNSEGVLSLESIVKESVVFMNEWETTKYINNYMGKPKKTIETVSSDSIYGYDGESETVDIVTEYEYNVDGTVKKTITNDLIEIFEYDSLGNLINIKREKNDLGINTIIETSKEYDFRGNVIEETDGEDNTTYYHYNKRGFLEYTLDADYGTSWFEYDRAGRKTIDVSPEGFDLPGTPFAYTRYSYDNMDRVILTELFYRDLSINQDVLYVKNKYEYDLSGNIVKEYDALGYIDDYYTEYTYNYQNQVLTIKDPETIERGLSFTTQNTYNALGELIKEENIKGTQFEPFIQEISYLYDDAGNMLKKTTIDKNTNGKIEESYTYDYIGNVTSKTDSESNKTSNHYNKFNKLSKTIVRSPEDDMDYITEYKYDINGNLKYTEDSMGKVEIFNYDEFGRSISGVLTNINGIEEITTHTEYDKNGNVTAQIDGNGVRKEFDYDNLDRVKIERIISNGTSYETIYDYDKNGNKIKEENWLGNIIGYEYDDINRLYETTDQNNTVIQKVKYNHNDLQIVSTDSLNNEIKFEYDKNNRLIKTTNPEQHSITQTYDNTGNVYEKIDEIGNKTTYIYDGFDRLKKVVNALDETTEFYYDYNGNIVIQKDGKDNQIYYEYNHLNLPLNRVDDGGKTYFNGEFIYEDAKSEFYTYYKDGKLKTKKDRNENTFTYLYDNFGRLESETSDDTTISYTYDSNGNQLTVTDSTGITTRTYDDFNRVILKDVPNIGITSFEYDITENLNYGFVAETLTDPKGNKTTKVYDKTGRLDRVIDGDVYSDIFTQFTYYDNGSRKTVEYTTGQKEEYTYYDDYQLETLINRNIDGTIMDKYIYTYDEANNQTSKYEIINSFIKGDTSYTYDELNRLKTITEPIGRVTTYAYDKSGNRKTETAVINNSTSVITYNYNEQNRLMDTSKTVDDQLIQTTVYTYDNNGNIVNTLTEDIVSGKQNEVINEYDKFNQLIKTITNGKEIINVYNGEGLRVEKTSDGNTTRYLYEWQKVILELDGLGNQAARNIYGTNLLTRTMGSDTMYYMYNGHADVVALINNEGTIIASYYYDAFGNILEQTGDVNNPYRYSGYQYDEETGLYYLNARMYDPTIARFMQEDTYRGDPNDPLSLNLYTYVFNNPLIYYDPTGHVAKYLRNGARGNDVKWVQEMLLGDSNYNIEADGVFGAETESVVMKFQKYYGLKVDGVVGLQTLRVLETITVMNNSGTDIPGSVYDQRIDNVIKQFPSGAANFNQAYYPTEAYYKPEERSKFIKSTSNLPAIPTKKKKSVKNAVKKIDKNTKATIPLDAHYIERNYSLVDTFLYRNKMPKEVVEKFPEDDIFYYNGKVYVCFFDNKTHMWEFIDASAGYYGAGAPVVSSVKTSSGAVKSKGFLKAVKSYFGKLTKTGVNKGAGSVTKSSGEITRWQAVKNLVKSNRGSAFGSPTKVGRWMSKDEYAKMLKTGYVQEGGGGQTYAALTKEAFMKQASKDAVYVEFKVPSDSFVVTNSDLGWIRFKSPKSLEGKLALKKGLDVPQIPPAIDIKLVGGK